MTAMKGVPSDRVTARKGHRAEDPEVAVMHPAALAGERPDLLAQVFLIAVGRLAGIIDIAFNPELMRELVYSNQD